MWKFTSGVWRANLEKSAKPSLREYLSRYTQDTVPDIYYLAWRALVAGIRHKDTPSIIARAEKDFAEFLRNIQSLQFLNYFRL